MSSVTSSPEAKQRIDALVSNLTNAFSSGIDQLEWMTPETKRKAHEKLALFTTKIGYPDKWRDWSKLEIRRDDLLGNEMRAAAVLFERGVDKLGGPIDRTEWLMTPQTVNAYYNPPHERDRVPGGDPAAAVLRRDRRRRDQLRRDRRGHRPRDQPRLRRPGTPLRRQRQSERLVGAGRTTRSSPAAPRSSARSTTRRARCRARTSTAS